MSVNSEYKRFFIILQEDDKGYETSPGKIPTGYVKVEIKSGKARLTVFAQNLKSGDKAEYRFLLIAASKKSAVDIGKIIIDNSGRGELHYEFESDNVLNSNMDISQFNVAAIATTNSIPLSGYVGRDKIEWKNNFEILNAVSTKERIDKVKEKIEEVIAPITQKPAMQETAPATMKPIEKIPEAVKPEEKDMGKASVIEEQVKKPAEEAPEMMKPVEKAADKAPEAVEQNKKSEGAHEKEMPYMQFIEADIMKEIMPEIKLKPEPASQKKRDMEDYVEAITEEKAENEYRGVDYSPVDEKLNYDFYYYDDEDEDYDRHKKKDNKHNNECNNKCESQQYKDNEEYDTDYDNSNDYYYQSPLYKKLEKVFGRLREYNPFEDNEKGYKWFKVEDDIYLLNSAAIPFMGAMMPIGYPFMMEECALLIGKKDYIIGVKYDRISKRDDRKYARLVCYGVPGVYSKREEMYYKMKGYSHFKPHKSRNYGYWIMCVDIRTGQVKL